MPSGEAPLNIREAWVGLVLPCDPYLGYSDGGFERGVLSKAATRNRSGFSVPQDQAIAILEKEKPEAAAWWKDQGYPQDGDYFAFSDTEAKIISGVTHQHIIEVTDEMRGYPCR